MSNRDSEVSGKIFKPNTKLHTLKQKNFFTELKYEQHTVISEEELD